MTVKDAAHLITTLINAAERAVTRPVLSAADASYLDGLLTDAKRLIEQPAPDGRTFHDTEYLLAQALLMHARAVQADAPRAIVLQQIIGTLLPIARRHFGEAVEARRAQA